jgi:type III secretory pathway component EscV
MYKEYAKYYLIWNQIKKILRGSEKDKKTSNYKVTSVNIKKYIKIILKQSKINKELYSKFKESSNITKNITICL